MNRKPKNRRRHRTFVVIAVVIGMLGGLLVGEIALRIHLYITFLKAVDQHRAQVTDSPKARLWFREMIERSSNPRLLFRLKPNLRGVYSAVPFETNSIGLRDSEVDPTKDPNVIRVLGLGDSTMWGFGVLHEETYPDILEREMRKAFGNEWKVEVINAAVPGYNTVQEIALFHELYERIQPDAVLIQFDPNDTTGWPAFFFEAEQFFSLRTLYLTKLPAVFNGTSRTREFLKLRQFGAAVAGGGASGWAGVEEAYRRLRDTCSAAGLPLFAIVPFWNEAVQPDEITREAFARFDALCRDLGIPTIETLPDVLRYVEDTASTVDDLLYDYPKNMHPTALGHALMANAIFPSIFQRLAKGRLSTEMAADKLEGFERDGPRLPETFGFYDKGDWRNGEVRWSRRIAQVGLRTGTRKFVLKYRVGHPDLSPSKPVAIRFQAGSSPVVVREHSAGGLFSAAFDLSDDGETTPVLQIELSRTFRGSDGRGRRFGIGVYPIEYEELGDI